eukprot:6187506-Pleurochrysis_carterae.AAC.2
MKLCRTPRGEEAKALFTELSEAACMKEEVLCIRAFAHVRMCACLHACESGVFVCLYALPCPSVREGQARKRACAHECTH